jgi:RHS repeat-associated protein
LQLPCRRPRPARRGWLAFYQHTVKDVLQKTYSQTTYNQSFPTAGMAELVTVATTGTDQAIDPPGDSTPDDKLIRSVVPLPTATAITGTTPNRQFVRVEQTTTVEKEVGGANDGDTLRTVVDDPAYSSTYGFVTGTTRTVTQPGVTGNWVTTIDFDRQVIDGAGQWCLGLPDTVVTSNTLPGGSPVSRTLEYDFNSDCTLDQLTDLSESSSAKQLRRKLGYDDFGNVTSVKEYSVADGPTLARETTFAFDADGQFPDSVTVEGVDLTTTFVFDPLSGLKTSVTGPDGLETSYEYDAFGRLTNETRPAGDTGVSYRTCASGGCFAPHAEFYVKSEDSTGATSYSFFDAFERPVGSDTPLANGRRSRTKTEYQASGRVDRRSLPYVAGEETTPGIHWVTTTYDAIGRPLTESDESDAGTITEYLGLALEVTDGKSHTTHYLHNALGQIEEVEDAAGGTTAYTYYPFGELHTVTDNDSNTTTVSYDPRGLKSDMDDPDLGHWTYVHNAFGELVSQTDAKSQTLTLEYDDAGRLESRNDGGTDNVTTWEYYPYNYGTAGHAGHLKKIASADEVATAHDLTEEYVYNSTNGAVASITRSIGSASYVFEYSYDGQGRLSQLTYPTNVYSQRLAVAYAFDSWGVLTQVSKVASPYTVYYALNTQDGSGAVRKATLGNGIVEQYGYEPETGQLATIKAGLSGSAALQNLELEWDLAGNLETRKVRDASNTLIDTDVFGYDALDRLLSQTRDSTAIFGVTYDTGKIGNIATKTGVTGTYSYGAGSAGPHALTSIGTSMTFEYDENGNMRDRNGDTITWTSYNLPSRIDGAGSAYSEFLYGGDRSRYVQKEDDGSSTHTRHYAAPGLFEAVYSGSTHVVDYQYVHANGRAVAQITTTSSGDDTQYLHRDHQGSVVATTNTSGTVLDRFEYDPLGQRTATVGSEDGNARGYTGHEHLAALNLIHMNGRVQDPLLGRFLSADPTVQAADHSQSLNRYAYVWNNPLTRTDPSGFCSEKDLQMCSKKELVILQCNLDPNCELVLGERDEDRPGAVYVSAEQFAEFTWKNLVEQGGVRGPTSDSGGGGQQVPAPTTHEVQELSWQRVVDDLSGPGPNHCGAAGGAAFPNAIGDVLFDTACERHDNCFGTLGESRWGCNWTFRSDIRDIYHAAGPLQGNLGDSVATLYFLSVTLAPIVTLGIYDPYQSAQNEAAKAAFEASPMSKMPPLTQGISMLGAMH